MKTVPKENSFRVVRKALGWTQAKMAEHIGYTRPHYVSLESKPDKELTARHRTILAGIAGKSPATV